MNILESIRSRAAQLHKTVVLPEGDEERNQQAAAIIDAVGHGQGCSCREQRLDRVACRIQRCQPCGHRNRGPRNFRAHVRLRRLDLEKRKAKGMTPEKAAELSIDRSTSRPVCSRRGLAHALVTGAVHSTGDMLRPALQILGTAPGNKTVSSMFLMVMPDGKLLGFGDCAVIPRPDRRSAIGHCHRHCKDV